VWLDEQHVDLVRDWQTEHGGTFSEALRGLLDAWTAERLVCFAASL